ncbi:hypothetical protein ACFQ1I_39320 [Kitasatospora arboriphila]
MPEDEEEAAALWRSWLVAADCCSYWTTPPTRAASATCCPAPGRAPSWSPAGRGWPGSAPSSGWNSNPSPRRRPSACSTGSSATAASAPTARPPSGSSTASARLPLAVRVCGTKLAVLHQLSAAEYAARLDRSPALLDELAAGDLAVRRQLAVWWAGLPAVVRAVLCAFG